LDSPLYGTQVLQLSSIPVAILSVHHTDAQNVEDIPVACEFPDVFPEDLPGMPPDRDVEFVIELQPGTTPISRRPYKMTPKELAELRFNGMNYWTKDTSVQVHHLGVVQHYS
jgi:hypothetical protein